MSSMYQNQRIVPLNLKLRCFFGGFANQVGWAIFGFSLIFVFAFLLNGDFESLVITYDTKTEGKITSVAATHYSEGGSKHSSGRTIKEFHYSYSTPQGSFSDQSYSPTINFQPHETVVVEYSSKDPHLSRILGTRAHVFSAAISFVGVFPCVALGFIFFGTRKGSRAVNLLTNGILTKAKFTDKRSTNMTVNKRPVFEYFFEFKAFDGRLCKTSVRTSNPELILNEEQESLLYHPEYPERAMLIDDLPAQVKFTPSGAIDSYKSNMLCLLLPAVIIGGIFYYFGR